MRRKRTVQPMTWGSFKVLVDCLVPDNTRMDVVLHELQYHINSKRRKNTLRREWLKHLEARRAERAVWEAELAVWEADDFMPPRSTPQEVQRERELDQERMERGKRAQSRTPHDLTGRFPGS